MSAKDISHQPDELSETLESLIIEKLEPYLLQSFGYHALLYTPLAKAICCKSLAIKHRVVIADNKSYEKFDNQKCISPTDISLFCHYQELSIASDSIDLAVLPNILQNNSHPHQILREVERVLIAEGTVILIGRMPLSWQSIKKKFKRRYINKNYSDQNQTNTFDISYHRVADWFRLLGLEMEAQIRVSAMHQKLENSQLPSWFKHFAKLFCDCFASYYIIIAKKKVSTLTPIRMSWRKNKQLVPSRLAEPSVKGQVESWFERFSRFNYKNKSYKK